MKKTLAALTLACSSIAAPVAIDAGEGGRR